MRRLAHPQVVTSAAIAATLSALLSAPRMLLWDKRPFPLWYGEAIIFLGGFVLWAFVFAWHTEYTHRPVFTLKIKPPLFAAATLAGILAALSIHWLLDPTLRVHSPQDYPVDFRHWIASTLFALAFTQLFLIYSPFAWVIRLIRNEEIATWMTVVLSVVVLLLKTNASPTPLPYSLFMELLALRIAFGFFAIWFYLRGGILLVAWLGLLVESRHLLAFSGL
jgi:hypothetical protein